MTAIYRASLDDWLHDLEQASGPGLDRASRKVVEQIAEEAESLAREYAPKGETGELAASIHQRREGKKLSIVADAPHALFVEFGTWSHNVFEPKPGTYTIRPKRPGGTLRFPVGGQMRYAKSVEHPGIKPNPFMGRAASEVVEGFSRGMATVGVKMLVPKDAM